MNYAEPGGLFFLCNNAETWMSAVLDPDALKIPRAAATGIS